MYNLKNLFVLALGIFLLLSCGSSEESSNDLPALEGVPVTVMTYNTYGARPAFGEPPTDLPMLAAVINKYQPDLVALQEIDVNTRRSGVNVNQADSLAKLTGMNCFFAKAIDKDGGLYGDAVLSRHPILESKAYNMGPDPQLGGENRSVALIKVKIKNKEFYFAGTHLDHLSSDASRIFQANLLKEIVEGIDGNLILGGDFNAVPTSEPISIIKGYMTLGCKKFSPTFPSSDPKKTIDYLMYKPADHFFVQNYMVIDEPNASDHCPVISIIRIK